MTSRTSNRCSTPVPWTCFRPMQPAAGAHGLHAGGSALRGAQLAALGPHAPSIHAHPSCALAPVCPVEYFHDHERIEHLFFDGVLTPMGGLLQPDLSRPGMGLDLKRADAA